ncbi:MAG: lipid-A-disaccharide synthase-related protein [Cyanobacteria bacterium P01_A01_bin.114]
MSQRILFISNGHGEDNHSSHVIRALHELRPALEIAAIPIVGQGYAYRKLGIPIKGPTLTLPSGGFTYMDRWRLVDDIRTGLLSLTWQQLKAVRQVAPQYDLVFATGDMVGQSFAFASGRPFISFISPLSAMYEGRLQLDLILRWGIMRSQRCLIVFTRDAYTAKDLQRQGVDKAQFGGIPSLDWLKPKGKDLQLTPGQPMMALLPGSRLPEAVRNFKLLLELVREIAQLNPQVQFRAALVPDLMTQLAEIATAAGWQHETGWLSYPSAPSVRVACYSDAFNDIVCSTTLVLGMAGLAVDQAVAIGKPVLQIPGEGPQFTYAFAEAQTRLLGLSAKTIGTGPATADTLQDAARLALDMVQDPAYLAACVDNGFQRFGPFGASTRMAQAVIDYLEGADCLEMTTGAQASGDTVQPGDIQPHEASF